MSKIDNNGLVLYVSIASTVFVGIMFIRELVFRKHKKNGHYTLPSGNYSVKKFWAKWLLKRSKRSLDKYATDFKDFKSENISIAQNELNSDSQLIYGCDTEGNSLLIKITKQKNRNDEAWLILRLANGSVFTLPDRPQTNSNTNSDKFESSGLCIETMRHYKSLRITFIGLLTSRNSVNSIESEPDELRFVKFNFLWASTTPPKHYPDDWDMDLRASALATEPWNGENWISFLNTPDFGGYDQFGAMLGQVFVENINDGCGKDGNGMDLFEMNLPGFRKRRCLPTSPQQIYRAIDIIGVCLDGTVFELGAISYQEKLTHAQFGYIRHANNNSYPIGWTDLHLAHIADDLKSITPKGINIQFKANKILHSSTIYFVKNKRIPLSGTDWLVNSVPIEIGLNGKQGYGVAIFYNPNSDTTNRECGQQLPKLIHSTSSPNLKLALPFHDTDASSLAISGGKGASLALLNFVQKLPASELRNLKFHVPAGFIVTVSSFDLQMRRNANLTKSIEGIKNVAYGLEPGNLEEKCQEVVEKLKTVILEKEIVSAISQHFDELIKGVTNLAELKFAVRSSAIGEDGEDASSAGQNETFLGLRNLDEILESIRLCWASLFTYQSVEYRRQHVQSIDTQMSVVVQIMVHSDCAGVLFTRHPVNGDPSKILITANYGLGESVVSGSVDPDSYVVKRRYGDNELVIDKKQIGKKTHFLHMNFADGKNILEKSITSADQLRCCLSDEQILKLSEIGVLLENLYGNARDIEWAIYQNEFYLLQSRPITTLNSLSNWELLHEFDTAIMSKDDLCTFAVLGELFPDAISPLTISTIIAEMQHRQEETMSFKADFYHGRFTNSYTITHHRVAMNVYKMLMSMTGKELTRADKITAITMFGHEYITPEMHRVALQRNENADKSVQRKLLGSVVTGAWNNEKIVEANQKLMKTIYNRYSSEGLQDYRDADIFNAEIDFELNDIDRYPAILGTHFNTSKVSTVYQMLALILLTEGSADLTVEHYTDIALMLGSCKDVESAEVPKLLEEIAIEIFNREKANDFLNIASTDGMRWLNENCPTAGDLVKAFLIKHGHRALKEYDLVAITWGMKPDQVIQMIQTTVKGVISNRKDVAAAKKEMTNQEIISMLKTPKKRYTKFMLSKILPLCHKAVQRREISKSAMIAFIHEIRKAYRHLSELLYAEGLLPNTELIFYLHREEILGLLREPTKDEPPINKSKLITKAMRRMKLFPTWSSYRFNEMNFGVVTPINNDVNWNVDGNVKHVTGTPVCEGVITARACVIKSFEEVHKIQQGDILVTYGTDIGWSPYFPILGGIVTELGGLISHGAIVAREYGLPCVVGCTGATDIFKFGETITMNGSKGIIVKVDDESEAILVN